MSDQPAVGGIMNRTDFFLWLEQQPHGRYERVHGEVIEMSPELIAHARVKAAIWLALRNAIMAAGLASSCEALPDGVTVQVGDGSDYEPDVVVTAGERAPGTAIVVPNPVIVVEVLSRRTRRVDTTQKLLDYFTVPSIRHYLIVSADQQNAVHHRRLDDASIATTMVSGGEIVLDPPGITVTLASFYEPTC
jgi:Uma2 family endonuclease